MDVAQMKQQKVWKCSPQAPTNVVILKFNVNNLQDG